MQALLNEQGRLLGEGDPVTERDLAGWGARSWLKAPHPLHWDQELVLVSQNSGLVWTSFPSWGC